MLVSPELKNIALLLQGGVSAGNLLSRLDHLGLASRLYALAKDAEILEAAVIPDVLKVQIPAGPNVVSLLNHKQRERAEKHREKGPAA
jgi:hypothetical protein